VAETDLAGKNAKFTNPKEAAERTVAADKVVSV